MASLFDEELERQRKQLAEAGVTPQMIADAPNVAEAQSLLPVPLSPIEKMIERDGRGKTIGKMLLGGFTGMTPLLMPELIGGRDRYKAELDVYNDQRKRQLTSEQASPHRNALANNDKSDDFEAIEQLAMLYPDIYGPVLRDMQKNKYAPNPTTYTEGKYEYDPEYTDDDSDVPGRWYLERQGSDGKSRREYRDPDFKPQSRMPGPEYIDKTIATADEKQFAAQANADEAGAIVRRMDEIGKDQWIAGYAGDASEFLKRAFGREDFITEVRKQYQDIKVRSAVQNLPPGVASDKDIELVLEPWPNDTSNFDLVRRKMEAIERVERGRAAYRLFESEWMATRGQRNGMQRAWLETNGAKQVLETNRNSDLDKPYRVITE